MSQERYEDLNLTPPEEGFELYRYKNTERMSTRGWSGLYWARNNEAGDYEIRAATKEGEGYSYPGGVFAKVAFERYYEKADLFPPQVPPLGAAEIVGPIAFEHREQWYLGTTISDGVRVAQSRPPNVVGLLHQFPITSIPLIPLGARGWQVFLALV